MNMTNKDFETIERALKLLPHGKDFENLDEEKQDVIIKAYTTMMRLAKKKKENNKKFAQYVAEKRKIDKNFARSKKK